MQSIAPFVWNQLRQEFSDLGVGELRSLLCRAQHYQGGDVHILHPLDAQVKDFLDTKGVNPSKVYQWLTRTQKTAYAERYTAKRAEEKWRRMLEIKAELARVLPEKTPEEVRRIVHRVSRWQYGEIKELSTAEFALRDLILKLDIKPGTLHNWLLHTVVPDDFRKKLENGSLAVSTAQKLLVNRERQRKMVLQVRLLEEAKTMVRDVLA